METAILQFFESLRSPVGTFFAAAFSLFGEALVSVLLICLVYWLVDKQLGERLVATTFTSLICNNFLKGVVQRPRPYQAGVVSRVDIDNAFISTTGLNPLQSFPSGHSQMGSGLFFSAALFVRKKWAWIVAPLLTLGVMWSRMYFGVHYFTDTLCGMALGIIFAVFWDFIYRKAEDKKAIVLLVFSAVSIILTIISPSKAMYEFTGCTIAATIALPIENKAIKFKNAKGVKNRLLRALVGIACVGVVYGAFSFLPFAFLDLYIWKFVKYFLTVLTGALLVPFLFVKLKI